MRVGRSEQLSGAGSSAAAPVLVELSLRVNGVERSLVVDTRTSLLDLLRGRLGLTGAKKGCDHGQCGACTVLLDGRRVNACLALAVAQQGAELVTVEGRRTRTGCTPPVGVRRPRRVPVRLLHAGPAVLGGGDAG
jgi:2Fe-2S iron-sulfur cluster binding domain